MTLLDQIEQVLEGDSKGKHVAEIAENLLLKFPQHSQDVEELKSKVSSALAQNFKSKRNRRFSKVPNGKGAYKKGFYKLKRKASLPQEVIEQPKSGTKFTGAAGEHAVLSELLFWGFNASIMTVDDGVDVVASKENKFVHIQVKTANKSESTGGYIFTVSKERFEVKHNLSSMYYVFVVRCTDGKRPINEFIILSSHVIRDYMTRDLVRGKDKLSFSITNENGKFILNRSEDVSQYTNNWGLVV